MESEIILRIKYPFLDLPKGTSKVSDQLVSSLVICRSDPVHVALPFKGQATADFQVKWD